jgi:hypothetical protein
MYHKKQKYPLINFDAVPDSTFHLMAILVQLSDHDFCPAFKLKGHTVLTRPIFRFFLYISVQHRSFTLLVKLEIQIQTHGDIRIRKLTPCYHPENFM